MNVGGEGEEEEAAVEGEMNECAGYSTKARLYSSRARSRSRLSLSRRWPSSILTTA